METLILLVAIAIATLLVRHEIRARPLPSSSADWFVVFGVDAQDRVLSLAFFPVIGIVQSDGNTTTVTSRPKFARGLLVSYQTVKVSDGPWGLSHSYGHWVRDGVLIDEYGNPVPSDDSNDFTGEVAFYLRGDFRINQITAIPLFYQEQLARAKERAKDVA